MQIIWTEAASEDLDSIEGYIFQDNPKAAIEQVLWIINLVEEHLSDNPGMGRSGRVPKTRELVVSGSPYIVVYRVKHQTLEILRIIHGAQQWPEKG